MQNILYQGKGLIFVFQKLLKKMFDRDGELYVRKNVKKKKKKKAKRNELII